MLRRRALRLLAGLAAGLLAAACGPGPAGSPPATSLATYLAAGPHAPASATATLALRNDGPPMPLLAAWPGDAAAGEHFPLVVLSHGSFSGKDRYAPVVNHWASHGFVVLAPDHVDANRGVRVSSLADMERVIRTRAADMSLVLDALDEVEEAIPGLAGRIDRGRPFVAAGHSVGTYVAMLNAGLVTRNPETGEEMRHPESRYGAVLMLSDPGKMALMPDELWRGINVPTLMATGSADFGLMGKGNRPSEYETEVLTPSAPDAGRKYLLTIADADHYFGGLIHKPAEGPPDHEGLALFNAVSVAFLKGHAAGDEQAGAFLERADIDGASDGRATLLRH